MILGYLDPWLSIRRDNIRLRDVSRQIAILRVGHTPNAIIKGQPIGLTDLFRSQNNRISTNNLLRDFYKVIDLKKLSNFRKIIILNECTMTKLWSLKFGMQFSFLMQ